MNRVLPLFRRSLLDGWRGLLGWTAGFVAVLAIYLPVYSSLAANGQFEDMIASLPPELVNTLGYDQIATGAGYVQATFFGLVGFVMISIAAVGWGTGAIANDEETGQLELTLAHGVTRGQLYAERTAAVAVKLAWLGLVAVVMVLALDGPSTSGSRSVRCSPPPARSSASACWPRRPRSRSAASAGDAAGHSAPAPPSRCTATP